jgi:hypothetical protein
MAYFSPVDREDIVMRRLNSKSPLEREFPVLKVGEALLDLFF